MTGAVGTIVARIQSIGEVLHAAQNPLRVPMYQRSFSWTSSEVGDLLFDLTSAFDEDPKKEYFLGSIVLNAKSDELSEIVDGQQRLAVISMFFSGICTFLTSHGEPRAQQISAAYLAESDLVTQELTPKLILNDDNHDYFHELVVRRSSPAAPILRSNKLIQQAYHDIVQFFIQWLSNLSQEEAIRRACSFVQYLNQYARVIVIEVTDEVNAYIVFETLNDRGLALAVADLVKNYLFSRATRAEIDDVKRNWSAITRKIGEDSITVFIRYYWLATQGVVREKALYDKLKESASTPQTARDLLRDLVEYADYYVELDSPSNEYWNLAILEREDVNPVEDLRALNDGLKVTQYKPIMIAAMKRFADKREQSRLIKGLVNYSVRNIIAGLTPSKIEAKYSEVAVSISNGLVTTAAEVMEMLRPDYVPDAKFKEDFKIFRSSKGREPLARYILSEINRRQNPEHVRMPWWYGREITLEHILPLNPNTEWTLNEYSEAEIKEMTENIGNLTLLGTESNKRLQNSGFNTKKRDVYGDSSIHITRCLAENEHWRREEIERRAADLADRAIEIWRI